MNTHELAYRVAAAIAGSEAVRDYCVDKWGRAPRVCLYALGEHDEAAGRPYPYIVVGPVNDDSGGPEAGEQTREIAALIVIDASQTATGDFADPTKPRLEPTGVYTVGQGRELTELAERVQRVLRTSRPGSVLRATSIVWNGLDSLPVQFAAVVGEYYEPKAFGDWT